jgi:hypothetical protein
VASVPQFHLGSRQFSKPNFWSLQIDEEANRSAFFAFKRTNVTVEFHEQLARRMAHVYAEHIRAGFEQRF